MYLLSKRLVKAARAAAPAIMTNAQTQSGIITGGGKVMSESGHEFLTPSKKKEVNGA
jgi:hypothetical protein